MTSAMKGWHLVCVPVPGQVTLSLGTDGQVSLWVQSLVVKPSKYQRVEKPTWISAVVSLPRVELVEGLIVNGSE